MGLVRGRVREWGRARVGVGHFGRGRPQQGAGMEGCATSAAKRRRNAPPRRRRKGGAQSEHGGWAATAGGGGRAHRA